MPIRKKIENGKVGILLCNKYPYWYSRHQEEELLFLPELIDLILNKETNRIVFEETMITFGNYQYDVYGNIVNSLDSKWIYVPELFSFRVEWLDVDRQFYVINKYDVGNEYNETIITEKDLIIRS
jgi:hypothetical protein